MINFVKTAANTAEICNAITDAFDLRPAFASEPNERTEKLTINGVPFDCVLRYNRTGQHWYTVSLTTDSEDYSPAISHEENNAVFLDDTNVEAIKQVPDLCARLRARGIDPLSVRLGRK